MTRCTRVTITTASATIRVGVKRPVQPRLTELLLVALALPLLVPSPARAALPEPGAIYYGQVLRNNMPQKDVTVSLRQGEQMLASFTFDPVAASNIYVLSAPLFSPESAGESQPNGGAFVGDTLTLELEGVPPIQLPPADRGTVARQDISLDGTPVPSPPFTPVPGVTVRPTSTVTPTRTRVPTTTPTVVRTATPTGPPVSGSVTPTGIRSGSPTPTATATRTPGPADSVLADAIGPTDSRIPVADISAFPDRGVLRIENEIVRYDGKTSAENGAAVDSVAGTLNNVIRGLDGTTPTAHPAGSAVVLVSCVGDCDGNGAVSVSELIRGVNIALSKAPTTVCVVLDRNNSNTVTIDELVAGVANALHGCR